MSGKASAQSFFWIGWLFFCSGTGVLVGYPQVGLAVGVGGAMVGRKLGGWFDFARRARGMPFFCSACHAERHRLGLTPRLVYRAWSFCWHCPRCGRFEHRDIVVARVRVFLDSGPVPSPTAKGVLLRGRLR